MNRKRSKTALRSEIEYLVCGKQSDQENEQIIYRIIFAERLANNVYAMYRDKKTIKPACEVAAFAASMATEFVIPERVLFLDLPYCLGNSGDKSGNALSFRLWIQDPSF